MKVIGNLLHRLNKLEQTLHKYQKMTTRALKPVNIKR